MIDKNKNAASTTFVGSLAKGLGVLECFGRGRRDLGITDISRLTGIEKSGVQRLVNTLLKLGFLERDHQSRRYHMTPRAMVFAFNYLNANPLIEAAMPTLLELSETLNRTVALCVLDGQEIVYVSRLKRGEIYYSRGHLGERQPAYCTSGGRAILSALSEEKAQQVLEASSIQQLTPHTQTDVAEIMNELRASKTRGFSIQQDEFILGEINFAAPVVAPDGTMAAAITVNQLLGMQEQAELEKEIGPRLLYAARSVSGALGW